MRKAGGTTLRTYLKKIVKTYGLKLVAEKEAKPFEIPGERNDTLYIPHIRDPVKGAISQFKDEF
jgi:hypothetical protein